MSIRSLLAVSLTFAILGMAPAHGQEAQLDLVATFSHVLGVNNRKEVCLDSGSYLAVAKSAYSSRGANGAIRIYLRPGEFRADLYLGAAGDWGEFGTFDLWQRRCIVVDPSFAYGRIYRLRLVPLARWPEMPTDLPYNPFPGPPPPR